MRRLAARISASSAGSAMPIFAVGIMLMLAGAGFGIDCGTAYKLRLQLQNSVDAAALAAAQSPVISADGARAVAIRYIEENFSRARRLSASVSASVEKSSVAVSAAIEMPTSFIGVFGFDRLPIEASATATVRQSKASGPAIEEAREVLGRLRASGLPISSREIDALIESLEQQRPGTVRLAK